MTVLWLNIHGSKTSETWSPTGVASCDFTPIVHVQCRLWFKRESITEWKTCNYYAFFGVGWTRHSPWTSENRSNWSSKRPKKAVYRSLLERKNFEVLEDTIETLRNWGFSEKKISDAIITFHNDHSDTSCIVWKYHWFKCFWRGLFCIAFDHIFFSGNWKCGLNVQDPSVSYSPSKSQLKKISFSSSRNRWWNQLSFLSNTCLDRSSFYVF